MHTQRPASVAQMLCLILSYFPPFIAMMIMMSAAVAFAVYTRSVVNFTGHLMMCLTSLSFFFGNMFISFFRCVFTPAGYVPHSWVHQPTLLKDNEPVSSAGTLNTVRLTTKSGELRYCYVCQLFKPDDAHHCYDCGRCVVRMDHHCPWINNCVGKDTEKFFILFLCYVACSGLSMALCVGFGLRNGYVNGAWNTVRSVALVFIGGLFGIVMVGFGGFHLVLLWRGTTTMGAHIARKSGNGPDRWIPSRSGTLEAVFGNWRPCWHVVLPLAPRRDRAAAELVAV